MSFSFSTGVVDLEEESTPSESIRAAVLAKTDGIPSGPGRDEALSLEYGIVIAATDAAGLVRGEGKHVSFNISGHGNLVDGEFTNVSLSVSASRAEAPEPAVEEDSSEPDPVSNTPDERDVSSPPAVDNAPTESE